MVIKLIQKLGWWFFCKIGDPIFSPSQAAIGDTVCLWCGKQHGKLTEDYVAKKLEELRNATRLYVNHPCTKNCHCSTCRILE